MTKQDTNQLHDLKKAIERKLELAKLSLASAKDIEARTPVAWEKSYHAGVARGYQSAIGDYLDLLIQVTQMLDGAE